MLKRRAVVQKVVIEGQGENALLRLNGGVTNALNPELVEDLGEALRTVERRFRGLVLAGGEKFFSMGLDLPTLIPMERDEFTEFYVAFNRVVLALFTLPMPTCCAIAGHAVAGGTIIALGCDYRFAVSEKKLGLNEIRLGVPVPYLADLILRQIVGDRQATEMIYGGDFLAATDAARFGLVDALHARETLDARAVEKVTAIASHPHKAFIEIKKNRVESIRDRYEQCHIAKNNAFIDCWFSDPVRRLLDAAAQKF
jgi:enoyl-CoA hydratase/carnithine racemase